MPRFLGLFGWCILSFASAKMNAGNNIVLSAYRVPWVRFVIFVVHQTRFPDPGIPVSP
jgi:hypothetical protein